ncbi:hypothetical protein KUG47_12180 [Falsochrobactrum sp. TDYN1]|uniref:DUF6950 domain-containing protein n=1 Tax=Falsochrobactrum tianjinense TaxID=2706015 RepID=A0A949UUX0_9HYPH|nr:hypothetical protein [Falsochrobactrum sp. TDYN1]MBV2144252.1 hypothetical protein [Falsochrobactrum sp. TDYN1]
MRVLDWEKRLVAVTEAHLNTPLVWGKSDCLLTTSDAIEAVLGDDPAEEVRGKYKSRTGAHRLIKQRGFDSIVAVLVDRFEEIPTAMAGRGDVGIYQNTVGYFCEYGFAVKGGDGLRFLPRTMAERAFKVS